MNGERLASGFRRLGVTGVRGLPMPRARARTLSLEAAWRLAAGPSLARRATVARFTRGVLEIRVAEPAWRSVVARLLPEIEARLARENAALGIARVVLAEA